MSNNHGQQLWGGTEGRWDCGREGWINSSGTGDRTEIGVLPMIFKCPTRIQRPKLDLHTVCLFTIHVFDLISACYR